MFWKKREPQKVEPQLNFLADEEVGQNKLKQTAEKLSKSLSKYAEVAYR
ncbi:MAG: hypothetical protein ACI85H_000568 [Paracoccaceae bacterium]|jgi:hypothetical protein